MPVANSISSNSSTLSYAAESAVIKVLPGSPIWKSVEPNTYSSFGGGTDLVAREPISATRQDKRGTIAGINAEGGWQIDTTQNNMIELMQGFMFADALEKNDNLPLNATADLMTDIGGVSGVYTVTTDATVFLDDALVFMSGNALASNNGLGKVTSSVGAALTTDITTSAEASPNAKSRIQEVGFQFAADDATLAVSGGLATLGTTVKDLTTLGLNVGEWIFVGGDASNTQFDSGTGYARIASIAANAITLDKVTWVAAAHTPGGETLRIFFGTFLRNAIVASDIICRSYQFERTLGDDANGTMSEYLVGAVANDFTLNVPVKDKLTADVAYIALDKEQRDGTTGVKTGARESALGESAYNTSSDVFRSKMSVIDAATLQPTALFAYVNELTLTIANGVTVLEAVGVLGGFSITLGNFKVGGSATAYFATTDATQAVRDNADVTIDTIFAKDNGGVIYDIPLLGLQSDGITVEKDAAMTVPLEQFAAENPTGYTLGVNYMNYLPNVAMPTQ